MSRLLVQVKRSTLPVLIVLCLAALTVSYAYADSNLRPLATQVIGDPDAAVAGKFAVGTATPGNRALTVVGAIDFLGAGTVHNYFTQGGGNNMQINTNVDEANTVGDATKSQWKLVMGSSLDWFSIRRSPAGGTYNEDALFFIEGSTGNVGIATVDTSNGATIPFTPAAKLHVEAPSGTVIYGHSTATTGYNYGVIGETQSTDGTGVYGRALGTSGGTHGVWGQSTSTSGVGVLAWASASTGVTYGVSAQNDSMSGRGVYGYASATTGTNYGVFGATNSASGYGVYGIAGAITGTNYGVYGESVSGFGSGVYGYGAGTGVLGRSITGIGVQGYAAAANGPTRGVAGRSDSASGAGVYGNGYGGGTGVLGETTSTSFAGAAVYGHALATVGQAVGVYGRTDSQGPVTAGYGVYSEGAIGAYGDLIITGTKSAIVETEDYGWRNLYAMESPQNWFEDFGQATLTAGEVVVPIEEVFAETVNLEKPYHVFLTPMGDCSLYLADKSATAFTVRAHEGASCEISFEYRIIAPRLDYEDLRLKPAEDPAAVAASIPEVK